MMQNQMGSLKDLEETDYFELMAITNTEEPRQELEDIINSI